MTTKPRVKKFRIRRKTPDEQGQEPPVEAAEAPKAPSHAEQIAAISKEGLTGRQLRMARRVAVKNGFEASSDYDAVRQLRAAGIDPFQRSSVLELVKPDSAKGPGRRGRIQLPDTMQEEGVTAVNK